MPPRAGGGLRVSRNPPATSLKNRNRRRRSFELLSKISQREEVNPCARVQPLPDRYSTRVGRRRRGPETRREKGGGSHEALLVLGGARPDSGGRPAEAPGHSPGERPQNGDTP